MQHGVEQVLHISLMVHQKIIETDGFLKKLFGLQYCKLLISMCIYQENSPYKTQAPEIVEANPFGLKNMLGKCC